MADDWEDEGSSTKTSFGGGGGFGRGFGKLSSDNMGEDDAPRRKGFGRGSFRPPAATEHTNGSMVNGVNGESPSSFGSKRGFGRGGGGGFGGFGGNEESAKPTRGFGGFGKKTSESDDTEDAAPTSGGGGGFGSRNRGGFGGGRGGGGFSGGDDGEDGGGRGGGFGGRGGGSACRKCGEEGHFARECPSGGGGGGSGRGGACHKCGEEGHFARECPSGGGGGGGGKGGACHKCGEEGHFARECPSATDGDESKPGPVTYVPPAPTEDEEEMFRSIEQGINFDKYDEIPVEVTGKGKESIKPIQFFEQAQLFNTLRENVKRVNYTKPTPVQKYAIPVVLGGRDVMACAQTGSGKTAAFLLPVMTGMLNHGLVSSQLSGTSQCPQALVVAPTRELASQIYQEARKFAFKTVLRPVVCYGGVSVGHQVRQIEAGCNLLVATPGRLLDFVEKGKVSLSKIQYLILDEADRMLDMGFEPNIRRLVETMGMPEKTERQTLMFSATFPEEIQRLAGDFLNDYIFLTVGRVGGTTSDIQQTIAEVSEFEKRDKLTELLSSSGTDRTLVFVESKRGADFLASLLSQEGFPTTSIHGDRHQQEREEALNDFRKGRCPVLIATNVAARGLDIDNVKHVINYDLPSEIHEFVHRIGRTGRIGHQGKATTFFQRGKDDKIARALVKVLSDASQEVPEWLEEIAESAVGTSYGPAGGRFASRDTRKQYGNDRRGGGGTFGSGWGGDWPNEANDSQVNGTAVWSPGGNDEDELWG